MGDNDRVRIGNQTAASAVSPFVPFEYAMSRGFGAFEWFPDRWPNGRGWSETDLAADARTSIRIEAQRHRVRLSVHGSWHASVLTTEGRERLASQAEFAADIGASVLVAHASPAVTTPSQFVDAVSPLVAFVASRGIALAIENTPDASPSQINELFRWFRRRELQSAVGLCLDIGHANLCAPTRNDYLAYVDQLAAETPIVHVHLHENWGDQDSHLTLFTGPSAADATAVEGLVDRLAGRRFAGSCILEQWPQPPTLLDAARDRLEQLIAARGSRGDARNWGRTP